jgi:hypothetical protein
MARPITVIALLAIASCARTAWSQDVPPGWRSPTAQETAESARNDNPTRYTKAVGDFNGDGVTDEAVLLKSMRFSGEALWVRLSGGKGKFEWLKLHEIDWGAKYPNVDLATGIDTVPPGAYSYGCFDDAKDCNFGPAETRPKLTLRNPGIAYFKIESAGSLFFWSEKDHRFLRVWMSD